LVEFDYSRYNEEREKVRKKGDR